MVLALDTIPRKLLAVLLAVVSTIPLGLALWAQYRADAASRQATRESLERAIALQPANAEFHSRLGRILLYSPLGEPGRARAELQRAVALDPRTAQYAVDLSLALELEGNAELAAQALASAREAEPRTPSVLWHEINFWLRREQNQRALALSRELLLIAPEYTARVVPVLLRVTDANTLLDQVVPLNAAALDNVLQMYRRDAHVEAAEHLWQRSLELGQPLPEGYVSAFVDWLLYEGRGDLALRIWGDASRKSWIPVEPAAVAEPFYNADFRFPLLNYGFDWRVLPSAEASVWIEARGPLPGQQSLCVQFTDEARAEYAGVYHYVPVRPAYNYALRAALRSEKLLARSGAWLQVQEMAGGRPLNPSTEPVVGNNNWKEVSLHFETGPETQLVRLVLYRPAAGAQEPPGSGLVCVSPLDWKPLGPSRRTEAAGAAR